MLKQQKLPSPTKTLTIHGRDVECITKGEGHIPCLIIGPAGIFVNEKWPEDLSKTFTLHFVDLWTAYEGYNPNLQLDFANLTQEIDQIREQLGHDKVAVFGHSGPGVLALEYARRYATHCLLSIVIATKPDWTSPCEIEKFVQNENNATDTRRRKIKKDDQLYKSKLELWDDVQKFKRKFYYKKGVFWKNYPSDDTEDSIFRMWDKYNNPNLPKINYFFSNLLSSYNFFATLTDEPMTVPTFWGVGMYDYSAPCVMLTDGLAQNANKYKNIQAYIFEEAAHYPMLEQRNDFAKQVIKFAEAIVPKPIKPETPLPAFDLTESKVSMQVVAEFHLDEGAPPIPITTRTTTREEKGAEPPHLTKGVDQGDDAPSSLTNSNTSFTSDTSGGAEQHQKADGLDDDVPVPAEPPIFRPTPQSTLPSFSPGLQFSLFGSSVSSRPTSPDQDDSRNTHELQVIHRAKLLIPRPPGASQ